ncbi:unnamed protein product [Notodromas monacha]|uniref:Small ribosomal subunit protein mS31 n=1 Tax=Notodromas monacha TaxID=399045 RepID=A0A7R9GHB5_9CRUS|nr:unnamed protein product [Notodromas monacha]CAG0922716.1 unnamed protein product [Notodromas monacha]
MCEKTRILPSEDHVFVYESRDESQESLLSVERGRVFDDVLIHAEKMRTPKGWHFPEKLKVIQRSVYYLVYVDGVPTLAWTSLGSFLRGTQYGFHSIAIPVENIAETRLECLRVRDSVLAMVQFGQGSLHVYELTDGYALKHLHFFTVAGEILECQAFLSGKNEVYLAALTVEGNLLACPLKLKESFLECNVKDYIEGPLKYAAPFNGGFLAVDKSSLWCFRFDALSLDLKIHRYAGAKLARKALEVLISLKPCLDGGVVAFFGSRGKHCLMKFDADDGNDFVEVSHPPPYPTNTDELSSLARQLIQMTERRRSSTRYSEYLDLEIEASLAISLRSFPSLAESVFKVTKVEVSGDFRAWKIAVGVQLNPSSGSGALTWTHLNCAFGGLWSLHMDGVKFGKLLTDPRNFERLMDSSRRHRSAQMSSIKISKPVFECLMKCGFVGNQCAKFLFFREHGAVRLTVDPIGEEYQVDVFGSGLRCVSAISAMILSAVLRRRFGLVSNHRAIALRGFCSENDDEAKSAKAANSDPKKNAAPFKPSNKLQELLLSMKKTTDVEVEAKKITPSKPGGKEKVRKLKEKMRVKTFDEKLEEAARKTAETVPGDPMKTESELLRRLRDTTAEAKEKSLEQLVVGMKIEKNSDAVQSKRSRDFSDRARHLPLRMSGDRKRIDLFGAKPLGIFAEIGEESSTASLCPVYDKFADRELALLTTHPPKNALEEMIVWTDQGKLWKFPIDNEQGWEQEKNVSFEEHVFLEEHLEPWCPESGPVRTFMELVCYGLSMNPWMSVSYKKQTILWYKDYFASKEPLLKAVDLNMSAIVKEGFLCPMCMEDLESVLGLQAHFENVHQNPEDSNAILQSFKGAIGRAKKVLKEDLLAGIAGNVGDSYGSPIGAGQSEINKSSSSSLLTSIVSTPRKVDPGPEYDPETWRDQPLGVTRSHFAYFKQFKQNRHERYATETNKLILRLDKLVRGVKDDHSGSSSPSRIPGSRRDYEKAVVPWIDDSVVKLCPECAKSFGITNRRHHCRLCGMVMCQNCSCFVDQEKSRKLTSVVKSAVRPQLSDPRPRRHSSASGRFSVSMSEIRDLTTSLKATLTPDAVSGGPADSVRVCKHCNSLLSRRLEHMMLATDKPPLLDLYDRLKIVMAEGEILVPKYVEIIEFLHSGHPGYNVPDAQDLRQQILKAAETIDCISKKISVLGVPLDAETQDENERQQVDPKTLQLQAQIRSYAIHFLKSNMIGLPPLPSTEQIERAKEERALSIQRRIAKAEERDRKLAKGDSPGPVAMSWTPRSDSARKGNVDEDPLLQQIRIIESYIDQARAADRLEEVLILFCPLEVRLLSAYSCPDVNLTRGRMEPRCAYGLKWVFFVSVCICFLGTVYGDVVILSRVDNRTSDVFPDLPATFGRAIPDEGIWGEHIFAVPADACHAIQPAPIEDFDLKSRKNWIAVIKKGGVCDYKTKIFNAMLANYSAAIIYNVGSNRLELMRCLGVGCSGLIPSIFIGADDGMFLSTYESTKYILHLTDELPFDLNKYLLPFAIVVGVSFMILLLFMIYKCIRDSRRARRHRMPWRALKKIPQIIFKKGDPYDICAICLDEFVEGEKLRLLNCSHAFHCKCVDPWLTKTRRVCPICKRKVFASNERQLHGDSSSDDDDDGNSRRPVVSGFPFRGNQEESEPLLGPAARVAGNNEEPSRFSRMLTFLRRSPVNSPSSSYGTVDVQQPTFASNEQAVSAQEERSIVV